MLVEYLLPRDEEKPYVAMRLISYLCYILLIIASISSKDPLVQYLLQGSSYYLIIPILLLFIFPIKAWYQNGLSRRMQVVSGLLLICLSVVDRGLISLQLFSAKQICAHPAASSNIQCYEAITFINAARNFIAFGLAASGAGFYVAGCIGRRDLNAPN